jgi:hypothetical protein
VLPDDPDLFAELSNVRIREASPNVYRLDHDQGQHDDRAIALALCVQHLLDKPQVNLVGLEIPVMWSPSASRPESAGLTRVPEAPIIDFWYR